MTTPAPFIDITGFPAEGEYVPPTLRAAEHLIAGGWKAPCSVPTNAEIIGRKL